MITKFAAISGVYALIDPRSGRTMYIGQSVDIEYRFRQHLDLRKYEAGPKREWFRELASHHLRPVMRVLEECTWPESDEVESRLILEHKSRGECELNRAPGGIGVRSSTRIFKSHRDDWYQLGRAIKQARTILSEAALEAERVSGKKAYKLAAEAIKAIDRFKWCLEGHAIKAYPEWEKITAMFSGTDHEDDSL